MKTELKSITPAGTFTRTTASKYTHIVVWNSPRAAADAANPNGYKGGVSGRWLKDRGYGVTWHSSEGAANKAVNAGYGWDSKATLVGVFPVEQVVAMEGAAV